MNTVIEEKTPKGISLKIMIDKAKFLAFSREGATIYADEANTKLLHDIFVVVFIGKDFVLPPSEIRGAFTLHKVLKGKALVVFKFHPLDADRYLFLPVSSKVDLIPMQLRKISSVAEFVKALQGGLKPHYIVVTNDISKGDIVIIKNRCSVAHLIFVDNEKTSFDVVVSQQNIDEIPKDRRATDIIKEVNINMFSDNPVFLARIHLRELNFAKVNQLLLDFDLSIEESEYILSFLNKMIERSAESAELAKNKEKIISLKKSFLFYLNLLKRNDDEIRKMISECKSQSEIVAYRTLIAKLRQKFEGTEEGFVLIDYDNLLYEQYERYTL